MSKYNSYAKKLDELYRAARDEHTMLVQAYKSAKKADEEAKRMPRETFVGERAMKQAKAHAAFLEAENALRTRGNALWDELKSQCAALGRELEQTVRADNLATPDAIDSNALELLKSGILNADDMEALAVKYDNNPTMLRFVGKYAEELANKLKDSGVYGTSTTRGRLYTLAANCKDGRSKIMRGWDDLCMDINYCSGIGSGNRRRDHELAVRMGEHWDEYTTNKIANF